MEQFLTGDNSILPYLAIGIFCVAFVKIQYDNLQYYSAKRKAKRIIRDMLQHGPQVDGNLKYSVQQHVERKYESIAWEVLQEMYEKHEVNRVSGNKYELNH